MSVEFVRDLGQPMPNIIPKINKIDTKNLVLLQAKFNQISSNAESTLKFCDEIYNIMHPNNKKFNIRGPSSRRRRNEFGRLYRRSRYNNFMKMKTKNMTRLEANKLWKTLSEEEKREYEF